MAARGDIEERLQAVERLTRLFRAERMAYLFATMLALSILFFNAYLMVKRGGEAQGTAYASMFGSAGMITVATGRLLHMWNQALRLIAGEKLGPEK